MAEWTLEIVGAVTLIGAYILFNHVRMRNALKEAEDSISDLTSSRDFYHLKADNFGADYYNTQHIREELERKLKYTENLYHGLKYKIATLQQTIDQTHMVELPQKIQHITDLEQIVNHLVEKHTKMKENLTKESKQLAANNKLLTNERLQTHKAQQQISNLQQTIKDLTEKLTETEESLTRESWLTMVVLPQNIQHISNLEQTINDLAEKHTKTEENLTKESKQLAASNKLLTNERLQTHKAQQQISNLQQTIKDLTEKLTETEENLTRESRQSAGNLKMLINERLQSKEAKQALKKKCADAKTEKDQLEIELVQLKKTKLVAIQTALDDLNKRAETISNQIPKIVRNNNRDNYMSKFKKLKEENDCMILDLKTVTFNTRLYESDHDALLKTEEEADRRYSDSLKKMNRITADCKRLISEYNSSIPDRFFKSIADHTRDLDILAKINFNSDLTNVVAMEHKVLNGLLKEREMLESILRVEKCNNLQTENDKPNNLEYINNLNTSNTYHLMVYNMAEASDDLSDIISFQTFMHQATGKYIKCYGVDRFGAPRKTPRPAKITLSCLQDFEDVLNSKAEKEYSHLRIEKFVPNKKQGKTNVG